MNPISLDPKFRNVCLPTRRQCRAMVAATGVFNEIRALSTCISIAGDCSGKQNIIYHISDSASRCSSASKASSIANWAGPKIQTTKRFRRLRMRKKTMVISGETTHTQTPAWVDGSTLCRLCGFMERGSPIPHRTGQGSHPLLLGR